MQGLLRGSLKALIVTADDFGLAPEINEGVELAHTNGILTTASLMVSGAAAGSIIAEWNACVVCTRRQLVP